METSSTSAYVVTPRWLIPVEPHAQVLEEHALVVCDGRIDAIVPVAELSSEQQALERVDLPHHALLPGLINMHCHSMMALLRGLADDLPLMDWLENHIWPAETACVGEEYARDGMRLAAAEYIRGGTICFNDNYFYPDISAEVAREAGMRATVGFPIIKVPTSWATTAEEYFARGLEVHTALKDDPLINTAFCPHAPYTVTDESFNRIRDLSEELDIPVHLHLHETAGEVDAGVHETGVRPFARISQLGLMNERMISVHMTQLTHDEISELAETGAHVVHCPESNLKLGSGICPTSELLAAGVNVCIGTDGAASNNDLDMWGEMRTAAMLAKGATGDPQVLPAATVLRMATLNGAKALGIDAETGSLEVGKSADFCAVDMNHPETQPVHHIISSLIYAVGRHQVSDVWVAGRRLLQQGELTTLDLPQILNRAEAWRERLKEWA